LFVSQIAFFAKATDDAVASANRARAGVGAGGRASGTAWSVFLVDRAFHERFRLNLNGAFTGFNAFAGFRTDITFFAGAAVSADHRANWVRVLARTIATFAFTVFFVVPSALRNFWWISEEHVRLSSSFAGTGFYAGTLSVSQITFFAEASNNAVAGANRARVWVRAGGRASGTAWMEFLVGRAFLERFRLNLSGAFTGFNAFAGFRTDMSFFAGATGNADPRAHWVRVLARTIASFALTEFFVVPSAHFRWHSDGIFWSDTAVGRCDANALFVFQIAGFAEAANYALHGADIARMGIGAGGGASGATRHEDFVVFALRNFRWIGEEHVRLSSSFAGTGFYAGTLSVSQITFLAEATDDTVAGADRARVWVRAGGRTSGTAWLEHFVGWALGSGLGYLHGEFVDWCLAF